MDTANLIALFGLGLIVLLLIASAFARIRAIPRALETSGPLSEADRERALHVLRFRIALSCVAAAIFTLLIGIAVAMLLHHQFPHTSNPESTMLTIGSFAGIGLLLFGGLALEFWIARRTIQSRGRATVQ